jgi:hypothetical protein
VDSRSPDIAREIITLAYLLSPYRLHGKSFPVSHTVAIVAATKSFADIVHHLLDTLRYKARKPPLVCDVAVSLQVREQQ